MNSYEPFVRDKNMKFVTHSWYNKTLSFGTPFKFLKMCKNFRCEIQNTKCDLGRYDNSGGPYLWILVCDDHSLASLAAITQPETCA